MNPARYLLWLDCLGGLAVGVVLFAASPWLSVWFGVPPWVLWGMAGANFAYGCFSLTLAVRQRRPLALIALLAMANMAWGIVCLALAWSFLGEATPLGLAHFLLEGAGVGLLGWVEWRMRHHLLEADASSRAVVAGTGRGLPDSS